MNCTFKELVSEYSDLCKEVYGFRLRAMDWSTTSHRELYTEYRRLSKEWRDENAPVKPYSTPRGRRQSDFECSLGELLTIN